MHRSRTARVHRAGPTSNSGFSAPSFYAEPCCRHWSAALPFVSMFCGTFSKLLLSILRQSEQGEAMMPCRVKHPGACRKDPVVDCNRESPPGRKMLQRAAVLPGSAAVWRGGDQRHCHHGRILCAPKWRCLRIIAHCRPAFPREHVQSACFRFKTCFIGRLFVEEIHFVEMLF